MKPVYYLISITSGCVLALVLLEVLFRFLPVSNAVLLARIDDRYGLKHFVPNTSLIWSAGTTFAFRTSKRSNNFGFLSDYDFNPTLTLPLLVVIGDSYVEAAQVKNHRSHHSLLHAGLGGSGRVYGIGASGYALSSYLQYARMAREQFSPDAMIFVIVGNDFDESMCQYYHMGVGTWCFGRTGSGDYELRRVYPPPSMLRSIARQSALMRYLVFNAQIDWRAAVARLRGKGLEENNYVGNTSTDVTPQRLEQSKIAVDEFFDRLPSASGLGNDRISFVVDGIRQAIYGGDGATSESYFALMRRYFVRQGESLGYEVIDLHPDFLQEHDASSEKFEFPIDGHWNELGHYMAARAIAESRVFNNVFAVKPNLGPRPDGISY